MRGNKRLSEMVADSVREMILNNKIQTGEPLNEVALSESLGVSRTPVREAITSLEQEGLLKVISGKGAFVTELTIADYNEINELRLALEPMAAVKSLMYVSDQEIDEQLLIWRRIADDISNGHDISCNEMIVKDHSLHSLLIDRCHNERLINILWILRRQSMRYLYTVWRTESYNKETALEHLNILECMKNRDSTALSNLLTTHVTISNKYITTRIV